MNNNDIVRRTDIINRLLDRAKPLRGLIHVDDVIRTINVAPSVKPQEPKTGHWIVHPKGVYAHLVCDRCLTRAPYDCKTNYCPTCGIKMVEPQESEEI